ATTGNFIDGAETVDSFTWSFDSGLEAFDYLAAGESLVLTYTLTVTDSESATDTQDVVITINGTNDAPVISIEAGDSAAESLIETNAGLTVSDTLTTTDLDLTDTVSVAVTSVVESGNTSGIANATLLGMMNATTGNFIDNTETVDTFSWSFDSGVEAFDYLAAGESLVLTYTLTVTDSESATDTQDVVIIINGTNDAPVISIEAGDSAAESLTESNAGLTVSDTLTTTDLDLTDTVSVAVTSVVESGDTSGIANATLLGMMNATTGNFIDGAETQDTFSWSFDSGVEAFDYLAAGESLVLTYTLTVTDSESAIDTQDVVIIINGTNDAPVISIEAGDSAAESLIETNAGLTVSDTLTTTDLDLTDTVSVAVTSVVESGNTSGIANATLLGMMSATTGNFIDGAETQDSFTWSFDSGVEAFDYLAAGESLVLTYTLTVTDSESATDTQDVVITINGTNDAPVISIEAGDSAAESLIETNAGLTVSDTLTTTDLDLTDTVSVAVTSVVESGNNSGIANATLLGMMNATTGNFIDGAETQDTFTWSFDSGLEAFDYLAAGESLVLTYTLTVTDAPTGATDTQTVVITINGTNDAPVISIEARDSAAESLTESNAGLTVSDTLTTTDLDLTDTVSVAVTSVVESGDTSGIANATLLGMMSATTGNFIDGTETQDTFTWSFDSGLEAFDYLAAGESLVLTYTLTVTDAPTGATDTQTVVITINGTNDAPVISIEAGDSAAESLIESNAGLTVSDTLTTTDLDLTDTVSVAVTSVVESGDTSGIANATLLAMMSVTSGDILDNTETVDTFTWSFDSGVEAFDYLAAGESLVLTYTLTVTDAPTGATDTQTVVITINGTNDAPVISIEAGDS
ncbi:VCBS domain-containing protein, partial [Thiotrichales bacterium 19X7-9]|nr:VCBS domain-containing protein [Thiotrichales bacterium 19X7-9]